MNSNSEASANHLDNTIHEGQIHNQRERINRTTIGVKKVTKEKLDKNKAPGQCYDGFICQLVDLWEKVRAKRENYTLNLVK